MNIGFLYSERTYPPGLSMVTNWQRTWQRGDTGFSHGITAMPKARIANTFGTGWTNWILWHKAKSNCRQMHAWTYLMRSERTKTAIAAMEAALIWPFEHPGNWIRLWANILLGELPSKAIKLMRRLFGAARGK